MCLIIKTTRNSEKEFYEHLRGNAELSMKELCKKIPRTMAYKYLKDLLSIQKNIGKALIWKKSAVCPKTGMPIILVETNTNIQIEDSGAGWLIFIE